MRKSGATTPCALRGSPPLSLPSVHQLVDYIYRNGWPPPLLLLVTTFQEVLRPRYNYLPLIQSNYFKTIIPYKLEEKYLKSGWLTSPGFSNFGP